MAFFFMLPKCNTGQGLNFGEDSMGFLRLIYAPDEACETMTQE